jgi:hypothetical protein
MANIFKVSYTNENFKKKFPPYLKDSEYFLEFSNRTTDILKKYKVPFEFSNDKVETDYSFLKNVAVKIPLEEDDTDYDICVPRKKFLKIDSIVIKILKTTRLWEDIFGGENYLYSNEFNKIWKNKMEIIRSCKRGLRDEHALKILKDFLEKELENLAKLQNKASKKKINLITLKMIISNLKYLIENQIENGIIVKSVKFGGKPTPPYITQDLHIVDPDDVIKTLNFTKEIFFKNYLNNLKNSNNLNSIKKIVYKEIGLFLVGKYLAKGQEVLAKKLIDEMFGKSLLVDSNIVSLYCNFAITTLEEKSEIKKAWEYVSPKYYFLKENLFKGVKGIYKDEEEHYSLKDRSLSALDKTFYAFIKFLKEKNIEVSNIRRDLFSFSFDWKGF